MPATEEVRHQHGTRAVGHQPFEEVRVGSEGGGDDVDGHGGEAVLTEDPRHVRDGDCRDEHLTARCKVEGGQEEVERRPSGQADDRIACRREDAFHASGEPTSAEGAGAGPRRERHIGRTGIDPVTGMEAHSDESGAACLVRPSGMALTFA